MNNKVTATIAAVISILALSACTVADSTDSSSDAKGSQNSASDHFTTAQKGAIQAGQSYLDMGTGFSRFSLIRQLTSKAGNGFKRKDAVFAVNHLKPNWNHQAVLAAKGYMDMGTGFSRDSLLRQLTSKAGNGFTQAQAEYAVKKVGL